MATRLVPDRVGIDHRLYQPVEPLAEPARHRDDRHAFYLRQPVVGLAAQLAGFGLALDQVPFVHAEHQRPALALHQIGDAQVLLLERALDVHQHDHDFGETDRVERVGDGELLQLLLDARLAPHAGGVEQAEFAAVPLERHRDGVARDAGLRPNEQTLLAEQAIDQSGLADIGTTDDGDADRARGDVGFGLLVLLLGRRGEFRQGRADRVVEIRQTFAVLGRNRNRIAKAELIGLNGVLSGTQLALVGDDDDGLAGAPHHIGELPVDRRQAGTHIHQEQHRVGALDRGGGLLHHAADKSIRSAFVEARGVDHRKRKIAETPLPFAAVARHAGTVVDQREPHADEAIEQRRFADIRPPDDRESEAHKIKPVGRAGMRGSISILQFELALRAGPGGGRRRGIARPSRLRAWQLLHLAGALLDRLGGGPALRRGSLPHRLLRLLLLRLLGRGSAARRAGGFLGPRLFLGLRLDHRRRGFGRRLIAASPFRAARPAPRRARRSRTPCGAHPAAASSRCP